LICRHAQSAKEVVEFLARWLPLYYPSFSAQVARVAKHLVWGGCQSIDRPARLCANRVVSGGAADHIGSAPSDLQKQSTFLQEENLL
jgi:hypothetical protein